MDSYPLPSGRKACALRWTRYLCWLALHSVTQIRQIHGEGPHEAPNLFSFYLFAHILLSLPLSLPFFLALSLYFLMFPLTHQPVPHFDRLINICPWLSVHRTTRTNKPVCIIIPLVGCTEFMPHKASYNTDLCNCFPSEKWLNIYSVTGIVRPIAGILSLLN